jgi:WbqC-like protein family
MAYRSGLSFGKQYMDLAMFKSQGISIKWQEFSFPTYEQLFPQIDFIPNLSIIDTLFCCGPAIKEFLKKHN